MGRLAPIRDLAGGIIGWTERRYEDEPLFTHTLRDTMTAIGATGEPERAAADPEEGDTPSPRRTLGRYEIAGIIAGLLLALAAIALIRGTGVAPAARSVPTAAPTVAPTLAPTTAPVALQNAYASPAGALLGTIPADLPLSYQHSGYPGYAGVMWQGAIVWVEVADPAQLAGLQDLAEPTPRPAPSQRPVAIPASAPVVEPPACDPTQNPRYVVTIDLSPIGSVRGVSCNSQEEAAANAEQLAEQMKATAGTP